MNGNSCGIMLHHFHGGVFPKSQGSLSAGGFCAILDQVMLTKTILPASEYLERSNSNALESHHACITFDDGLLSQYYIAKPILDAYGITAFFFVHSLPFVGGVDTLELYRYFRNTAYASIDEFYDDFFREGRALYAEEIDAALAGYDVSSDRIEFSFYTDNDKRFRFLRATVLGADRYDRVMGNLIEKKRFDKSSIVESLYMKECHVGELSRGGHIIGLHSFSHPVSLHLLSLEEQREEYTKNQEHLAGVIGFKPVVVSHPCGKYTEKTLEILGNLGVTLGFAATAIPQLRSRLTMPREDSANIVRAIKK